MDSITFDSTKNKIIVSYSDGTKKEYAEKDIKKYIKDTQRPEDIKAMNWKSEN
jgi:hypothetical protein